MKYIFPFTVAITSFFLLPGCTEATGETGYCGGVPDAVYVLNKPTVRSLLLVDLSSSADSASVEAAEKVIRHNIEENLLGPGSRVTLALIHNFTTGKAGLIEWSQNAILDQGQEYDTDINSSCATYVNEVVRIRRQALDSSLKAISSATLKPSTRSGTDLWGALELVTETFRADTTAGRGNVYFVSDLLECKAGAGRRCFETKPPRNKKEAEAWAAADAPVIGEHVSIDPVVLKRINYHLVVGSHAQRQAVVNAKYYWAALMNHLGVPREQISFD